MGTAFFLLLIHLFLAISLLFNKDENVHFGLNCFQLVHGKKDSEN